MVKKRGTCEGSSFAFIPPVFPAPIRGGAWGGVY